MTKFNKILAFSILALGLLVYSSILPIKLDRAFNYAPVEAIVLDFSKSCQPRSDDREKQAAFDATPEFANGKLGPCAALAKLGIAESDFVMAGRRIDLHVIKFWRTHVRYVSPADGKTHESYVGLGPKDGDGLVAGKLLTLLAHKSKPEELQEQ